MAKAEEFYDPKQKYVWSMICDAADNLYIATGEQGEVHRVTPDGKGSVFFKSDETHARSLAFDHDGNLIVGTEPGGLVIRVSPKAKVSCSTRCRSAKSRRWRSAPRTKSTRRPSEQECGSRSSCSARTASATLLVPRLWGRLRLPRSSRDGGGSASRAVRMSIASPPQGRPEKLWSGAQDVVYALAIDGGGHLLMAPATKALYRVETRTLYSTLLISRSRR